MNRYRRFQSAVPNRRGTYPGVFAMANALADEGLLSMADERWLRSANDRANAAYPDPTEASPGCYEREANPGARSWFKETAGILFELTVPYLELLDRYGIAWTELATTMPGRIVHEDDVQVVAVPWTHRQDWPFSPGPAIWAGPGRSES